MTVSVRRVPRWVLGPLCTLAFLAYAANFLYFFVDDEGIPFIYARHLLDGRGLTYNLIEGRVEGYSDFLHVLVSTMTLWAVRWTHAPLLSVFFIGKGVSLACGAGIVLVAWLVLRRWQDIGTAAMATALVFLATAGPLAVWSCSSLETAGFALLTVTLGGAIWARESPADRATRSVALVAAPPAYLNHAGLDWLALAAAILLVLDRVDGFIFAGALIVPALLLATPDERRRLWWRVAVPAGCVFLIYQVWRIWYFGQILSEPTLAKVWFKVASGPNLITKLPSRNYLLRYLDSANWVVPLTALLAPVALDRHDRRALGLSAAVALLFLYVAIVGDWMFGFRFVVPILPLLALLLALGVQKLSRFGRAPVVAVAMVLIALSAAAGWRFIHTFETVEQKPSWWAAPTGDPARYFWPYYPIYQATRGRIAPDTVIACNQAGFVPFMLNSRNIDDLGLVSPFLGGSPATDVTFTEVGRYQPLTDKPAMTLTEAYLLHRRARYLFAAGGLLRAANGGHAPLRLLNGHYRFLVGDDEGLLDVYQLTDAPLAAFDRRDHFLENVIHISSLRRAEIDGRRVPGTAYGTTFSYLYGHAAEQTISGTRYIKLDFAKDDIPVMRLFADAVRTDRPAVVTFTLWSAGGLMRHRYTLDLDDARRRRVFASLPAGLKAATLTIQITPATPAPTTIQFADLRLLGQPAALTDYLKRMLPELRP